MTLSTSSAVTFCPLILYTGFAYLAWMVDLIPPGNSEIPSNAISDISISCPISPLPVASPVAPPNASTPAPAAVAFTTAPLVAAPVADLAADLVNSLEPTPDASLPVNASIVPIAIPLIIALFLISFCFSGSSRIAFTFSLVGALSPSCSSNSSAYVAPVSTIELAKAIAYGRAAIPPVIAPAPAPATVPRPGTTTVPAALPVAAPDAAPVPTTAAAGTTASMFVAIVTIELTISSGTTVGFNIRPFTTPQTPLPSSS